MIHIQKTGALIRTCIQLAALSNDLLNTEKFEALDNNISLHCLNKIWHISHLPCRFMA